MNNLNLNSSSLCLTDYAEELRFYIIHMTEVRGGNMCVCFKDKDSERKKE